MESDRDGTNHSGGATAQESDGGINSKRHRLFANGVNRDSVRCVYLCMKRLFAVMLALSLIGATTTHAQGISVSIGNGGGYCQPSYEYGYGGGYYQPSYNPYYNGYSQSVYYSSAPSYYRSGISYGYGDRSYRHHRRHYARRYSNNRYSRNDGYSYRSRTWR